MATEKTGISIDSKLLNDIDSAMKKAGVNSRSAFISKAVRTYLDWIETEKALDIVTPKLAEIVGNSENHIARVIYKDAVATAMMMHLMAEVYDIDPRRLNEIRGVCVKEVNHLHGKFKFEDAVYYEG